MSGERRMTLFGVALSDLFVSLILFNLVLCVVFALSYLSARGVDLTVCRPDRNGGIDPVACIAALRKSAQPTWLTIVNRSAIAASAVFVIGTAIGAAWEMGRSRVGPTMVVHIPTDDATLASDGDAATA